MVLSDEESGVDGKDLTVRVERYAVAGLHVPVLIEVGDELILEVTNCDEGGRVVGNFVLSVDRALEYTAILVDGIFREGSYRYPLSPI
jgi:hypothetical protein